MNLEATLAEEVEPVVETPELSLREQIETTAKEVSTRERDEAGRFASKATGEEPAKVARETPPAERREAPPDVVKPAAEAPERPTLAPNAWSHEAKAAFVNADPAIKAEIAKREADIHREFTKQDGERNFGRQLKQALDPYMQLIQAEGGNPVGAFKGYLETTRILRQGDPQTKAQLVRQMCQTFGIDPGAVSGGTQSGDSHPAIAPEVNMLQNEVADLRRQLQGINSNAENQVTAQLQSHIEAFASDPANIHFEAVKPHVAALLASGQARDLKEAYDMAVWARPDIRSSLIAQHSAADQAKRVAEARAKADAARRAGGSISGSPGIGASLDPKAGNRTLREELEANLASARI